MTVTGMVLLGASLLFAVLFFHPSLLKSSRWRATVTPLASIIGSGFLVAGPILDHTAGDLAWAAMAGLCAIAYFFGAAIRYNIVHVEPELEKGKAAWSVTTIERTADIALLLAYFVSVAYYLNLFAAFGLRLDDITAQLWIRVGATVVIAAIGLVGLRGGLRALEHLELGAVGLKLSVIGGLLTALTFATVLAVMDGSFAWGTPTHPRGLKEVEILLGLIVLVQGFETSRYLGAAYDPATRVKTMRWAQWISTGIYLAFILLVTRYFTGTLPREGGETAIINMLVPLGATVGPMIIVVALASQFSAAVADMNGAGGLTSETSKKRLSVEVGNLLTAVAAIAITWIADIYQIIAYASKIFVAYYALQSLQAALAAWRNGHRWRAALFAIGVVIGLLVVLFAIPAEV
ncbi:hypothetical protein A7A08_01133 [Methyloligella halotolerans]|uniref:Uncharacterized protein n=1 Tax=Methyloligella halotolerans TaxID=1177755 RepID=A0A1E2S0G9_9HYPH|nr:hypothetical protein [Methyloligella halotolerans]ODA67964.1 hypothetical protein A7A08_01133 [Methyloligella halotolerans]